MTELGIGWGGIDQPVRRLLRAELVEVNAAVEGRVLERRFRRGSWEAGIIESAAILRPTDVPAILQPLELIRMDLARGDIHHLDGPPVGAAVLDRIGKQLAVLAWCPFRERR